MHTVQWMDPGSLTEDANSISSSWVRCGVILAAGDGTRLQPLIRRLRGDALPKQYVRFVGDRSMLEQTALRVQSLLPLERIVTVVSRDHLVYPEVQELTTRRLLGNVVLQPANKETGPGLLLPLMHLLSRHPDSIVAVFPSDHFIANSDLFMAYVNLAYHIVEQNPWRMVLLGVQPHRPEPEYGYILPGSIVELGYPSSARTVLRFVEKPDAGAAEELARQGGVWNTMVMVFRTKTFLQLASEVAPDLTARFRTLMPVIGSPDECRAVERLYATLRPINLSQHLLEAFAAMRPSPLAVLPVRGVGWSDWGSERRIVDTLRRLRVSGETARPVPA